ncbi:DUF3800 domain-containing protein [Bosea sp. CS1GBMeth4]|uniref:DUF3800 domain-containing protein n=1 Tax=Bosea sp. CS1GBMeth4 TaxID=1892849 RepID=UPI0016484EE3|nr:DUF3800 domain-containing protein [Bosea sp. CS1GBMeth4]
MLIFIDETGSIGEMGGPTSIFAVGALIVPESKWDKLRNAYLRMRKSLPQNKGEVKGRLLDEARVAQVAQLLRRHEALFECTVIDLGMHNAEIVAQHQARQAEGMTNTLTDAHHQTVVDAIAKARRQSEGFSLPLYVQTMLTFLLVRDVLDIAPNYYAQRRPRELAAFKWVIDAKDKLPNPTPWEVWWSTFIMPWMQTDTLRTPIAWVRAPDFNFRFAKRFEAKASEWYQELLANESSQKNDGDNFPLDLRLIMNEHFRFSSEPEPGLELVDIVTSTVRRALVGNIRPEGWRSVRDLIVNRTGENLHILALTGARRPKNLPYGDVVKAFRNSRRTMFA